MKRMSKTLLSLALAAGMSFGIAGCKTNLDQSDGKIEAGKTNVGADEPDEADQSADESKSIDEVEKQGITAIGGQVLDADTLEPIQGAIIFTDPATGQLLTNSQGEYVIDVTEFPNLASYTGLSLRVNVNRAGYAQNQANITVIENQFGRADILMKRSATEFNVNVTPTYMQFSDMDFLGGDLATKSVTIQLDASPTVSQAGYTLQIPPQYASWLSVSPSSGTITGTPNFISVTINRANLPNGPHNAVINVLVNGATGFEPIALNYQRTDADSTPVQPAPPAGPDSDTDGSTDGHGADDSTDGNTDSSGPSAEG